MLEIGAAVIEIARDHFGRAETRGLAAHRFAGIDFAHDELAQRFLQLGRRESARRAARERLLDGGNGFRPFRTIAGERDAEKSAGAGAPGRRVNRVHQAGAFANLAPQHRAVTVTEHRREQVEHGRIVVRESGNRPREHRPRHLDVFVAVLGARRELERLRGHQHRGEATARRGAEMLRHGGTRGREVEIADDDDHEVVWHVARPIIGREILGRRRGKDIAVSDDRLAIGVLAKRRGKQRIPQTVVGIVLRHRDLAQDDVFFLHGFVLRQLRMQHRVGQDVDRHGRVFARQIDVVNRAVKCRVGVDVAAMRLHRGADFPASPAVGAFEQHVLQIVREARAEMLALVHAPRFHPHLHRGQRRRAVRLEDKGEAVGQNGAVDDFVPIGIQQPKVGGDRGQFCHEIRRCRKLRPRRFRPDVAQAETVLRTHRRN